jgi:tripeptidyl-peptidase-1
VCVGIPSGWKQVSRASPDQQLSLIFLLRQRNLDVLEARLMETSDPTSEEYGQHMTHAEVNALVAPEPRDIGAVLNWIRTHIHSSVEMESTPNMDFVKITATVEEAERMLHTQYHEYAHVSGKHQIVRALSYKLPSDIAPLIDSVGPTVRFPSAFTIAGAQPAKKENHKAMKVPARRKLRGSKAAPKKPAYDCTQGTTPDCLKGLYTVNDYVAATGERRNHTVCSNDL